MPSHLINDNNTAAELHYADDWYVLSAKPDVYALIFYCGCNDAACGYSGSVLYTRTDKYDHLSNEDQVVIDTAIRAANITGFTMDALCTPDNRPCPLHPHR